MNDMIKAKSSIVHTVTKVHSQPLEFNPGYGRTLGQFVDDFIREAIADGDTIGAITINIGPDDWALLVKGLKDNQDVSVQNAPLQAGETRPIVNHSMRKAPRTNI